MDNESRATHWRRLLAEHSVSGLSLRAFAARAGVSANTLAYWKYKRPTVSSRPAIVPVTVVDDLSPGRGEFVVEIGAARVRIPASMDHDQLVRLVRALGGAC